MHQNTSIRWISALQFSLSSLAAFIMWGIALIMASLGLSKLANGGSLSSLDPAVFVTASGAALLGTLAFPSAGFAIARILGQKSRVPDQFRFGSFRWVVWFLPFIFLAGHLIATNHILTWALLPPLHILAIGGPILWFLYLGGRSLPGFSHQRMWGILGASLFLGPVLILLSEILIGALVLGIIFFLLAGEPGFIEELERLRNLFGQNTIPDFSIFLPFFETYLVRPPVLFVGLLFVAVLVPIVEEFFKPVGVWFLLGRDITPSEGFLAGMLSGAGFALFESLFQFIAGQGWVVITIGRMGTSLVHIAASGIVGFGIAKAWRSRRFILFAGHMILAVLLHGIWNGLTALAFLKSLTEISLPILNLPWIPITAAGLLSLVVISFLALMRINAALRQKNPLLDHITSTTVFHPKDEDSLKENNPDRSPTPLNENLKIEGLDGH